ncbi:hypothetical protein Tco_1088135 [Tanacetum coccineum]
MVIVPIYQASSSVLPLSTPVIDLSSPKLVSSITHALIIAAITVTTSTTLTLPPPPPTQSSMNPELAARVLALEKRNAKLEQAFMNQNKTTNNLASRIFTLERHDLEYRIDNYVRETVKENVQISLRAPLLQSFRDPSKIEMKEILHERMFKSGSYKTHSEHADLHEALKRSMARDNMDEFIVEQAKSRKRCRDDQDPPQPPPKESDQSKIKGMILMHLLQDNTLLRSLQPRKQQQASQSEQLIDDVPTSDAVHISDSEDVGVAHLPKIKTPATWLRPLPEKDRPDHPEENKLLQKTGDMGSFIKWFCKRIGKKKLGKSDLEGPTFKVVKAFYENNISLQFQMEECDTTKRAALSISKLKATNYLDFRLEELVPSLWIESERDYNISAAYGITHWWFKRKEFYVTRHNAPYDRHAVRSHMRILSVISLKKFERYGYAFLKEIVIRRADYKEYKISEADFKNLHPNDFEDLYLLHLRGKLNHLPGSDKSYQTKLNLTQPNWDASDFLFKEDYTIASKPRSVIYSDRNEVKKMMRINEVHKFSDGTLTRVLDKLDHMVKDFRLFEYNRGMKNRIWSEDDKRRSKEFIEVIERRLKIRRIFKNLESFVGGRLRDVDYILIQRTE